MALNLFSFDPSKGETPETLKERRRVAAALLGYDKPQNVGEGIGAVLKGLAAGIINSRANKAEAAGRAAATDRYNSAIGALAFPPKPTSNGNLPATETGQQIGANAPGGSSPNVATGGLMDDFMAPVRETVKNPYALAAIAATGNAESGFDPAKANARWSDPSQSGQPGTAGGVMSWRNDRLRALEDYAKLNGEDPSKISAATQGKFFLQEDPNLITALNGAKSVEEAQGLMDNAWKYAGYDQPSKERAKRLASAQSYLSSFQPTETASLDPSIGAPAPASTPVLSYANSNAIRNQPIVEGLSNNLQAAVTDVYGPGARVEVYSGGQPAEGRRTGTVRHNDGRAADVRVYGADGKQIKGDALAPLGQYWRAKGFGGVGMEMHGGGIHLDDWAEPPPGGGMAWNYAKQGGTYTPQMAAAIEAGNKGVMPTLYAPPQGGERSPAVAAISTQTQGSVPGTSPAQALARRPGMIDAIDPQQGVQIAQAAPQGPSTQDLLGIISDQWATDSQRSVAEALLRRNFDTEQARQEMLIKQSDPRYQLETRKLQAEVDALGRKKPIEVNGRLLDPDTFEVIKDFSTPTKRNTAVINGRLVDTDNGAEIANFPDQPKPTANMQDYDAYAADERKAGREPIGRLQYEQEVRRAGASSVNVGGNSNKFRDASDEAAAKRLGTVVDEGRAAGQMISDMQQLSDLAKQVNTGVGAQALVSLGPYAEALGVNIEGLAPAQAYKSIIDRLAPTMRPAGSGASSDFDARQFLNSLPNVGNTPGANEIINQTLQAVSQNKIEAAAIARQAQMEKITWQEAEDQISKLPNPYQRFKEWQKTQPKTSGDGAQASPSPGGERKTGSGVTWSIN